MVGPLSVVGVSLDNWKLMQSPDCAARYYCGFTSMERPEPGILLCFSLSWLVFRRSGKACLVFDAEGLQKCPVRLGQTALIQQLRAPEPGAAQGLLAPPAGNGRVVTGALEIERKFGRTKTNNGVMPYNKRGEPYGFDFIMHKDKVSKISYNSYLC